MLVRLVSNSWPHDPPASASQNAGITDMSQGVSHHVWLGENSIPGFYQCLQKDNPTLCRCKLTLFLWECSDYWKEKPEMNFIKVIYPQYTLNHLAFNKLFLLDQAVWVILTCFLPIQIFCHFAFKYRIVCIVGRWDKMRLLTRWGKIILPLTSLSSCML